LGKWFLRSEGMGAVGRRVVWESSRGRLFWMSVDQCRLVFRINCVSSRVEASHAERKWEGNTNLH